MKLKLSPVRSDTQLVLTKAGDALTFNGTTLDFTDLPVGATLPKDAIDDYWIAGDVERDDTGELIVHIILPHAYDAPETTRFPVDMEDVQDGTVPLPAYEAE